MTKGKSKSPAKITRGLEDWFANTLSSNDFLQGKVISAPSINNTWGAYDPNINPRLLYEASLDPTVVGITTALENSVFKKGWYVESEEYDEDSLRDTLNEIGYFDAMKKLYSAWLRSDGNALLIKQQRDNGVYIRVEPFVTEGYQRVRVVSNPYTREITSYKIFSHTGSEIEEIEKERNKQLTHDNKYEIS